MRLSSEKDARTGTLVRFSLDRRWVTLVVAVLLGAGGGSLLGFLTAPGPAGDAAGGLVAPDPVASSTTRRPGSRVAGVSSSTRPRRPELPAATAARPPDTTAATSTSRPPTTTSTTSTTLPPSSTSTTTSSTDPSSSSTTSSSLDPPPAS
jgi:hypothetical protein